MSVEPSEEKDPAEAAPHPAEHFEEGEEVAPPGVRTMAVIRWLLVLAMATAAVFSVLHVYGDIGHAEGGGTQYYCPMHPSVVQDHPGDCPICSMTLVLREPAGTEAKKAPQAADHAGHRHEVSDPYYCPMHPEETGKNASARCPLCGMKLEPKPAQKTEAKAEPAPAGQHAGHRHDASDSYFCPMHPEETGKDASARCPLCGMKLEMKPPAKAAGSGKPTTVKPVAAAKTDQTETLPPVAGLAAIELPEPRIQLIGMRTAKVTRSTLPSELKAVGSVAPTESGFAVIQTRFSGWIEELLVSETGQLVQRGQLLARVYSPELLAAQQEMLNARRWANPLPGQRDAGAETTGLASGARGRLELMGMQPSEIAEVERSGTPHRLIEIRSPVRGYVAQKSAVQGLYIQPGTRLFDLADLSKVWVLVELFERDAGRIKAGQQATLQLTAYPGESFRGKVQLVYPTLNAETRTQRARIEFQNKDLRLRPGMFGDVVIQLAGTDGLVVPREAVVDTGEQQYVFIDEGAGRFSPRTVKVGARFQEYAQLLAGVKEGETVVTTGNFLLDSESRLRSAIEGSAKR
jgi:Cu(I)/Ag(I) efflux system membrane fusion protein